jgi:hypothetical protein
MEIPQSQPRTVSAQLQLATEVEVEVTSGWCGAHFSFRADQIENTFQAKPVLFTVDSLLRKHVYPAVAQQ